MEHLTFMQWIPVVAGVLVFTMYALPFKTEWKESAVFKAVESILKALSNKK